MDTVKKESYQYHIAGVAPVKSEYLLQDHVRELNLDFVAAKDKKKFIPGCDKDSSDEPPAKKLKGQNKYRPRSQKAPRSEKLCFKIGTEGSCPYGESCCYSHDVKAYLENKPPDLGDECYLFRKYGKCPYTFSCRFAKDHFKDEKNVVVEKLWEKYKDKQLNCNMLSKDLQIALRKRSYNFKKSDKALSSAHMHNEANDTIYVKVPPKEVDDSSNKKIDNNCTLDQNCSLVPDSEIKDQKNSVEAENFKNVKTEVLDNFSKDDTLLLPEIKKIDFKDKLYLAPLTTVGNLPFRRICKEYGADITCSEMTLALSLLQGQQSEWALIKRHHTEDLFGIQLCGSQPEVMTRCCQVLSENASFDFIDLNLGCPLDAIYKKGAGCGLMNRMRKLKTILHGVSSVIDVPLTLKMRTGIYSNESLADSLIRKLKELKTPVSLITLHGRSREQRYTRSADWAYIDNCNKIAEPIPLFGNGDILSYEDYNARRAESSVSGIMIARGALIKPWIFKEIKDQFHWDISSSERLDILRKYSNYGLEHWGSDTEGVEKTRRFLLEWLSFLYRYIPVGLLERVPQQINERPPPYFGRNDLETLMASPSCTDWVKISEMLLGPVPENFIFLPKHKANAYK
ncbi:tRNA-dihydrouridine(47) synthase [NAD(P)(+)]-like [Parasteatoda tepidariorum]|uniref:tRNA-dihydrouridine(47) synthase [NAD(P)(+)]-like n=1 Tax=Parasteatoda tepidariorum TaxID=114398 RepID=UPI00077FBAC6|nr:tRNA-dihydrouridine(47) synthase [NAD(P)(+)]-like [Parasteatoda tepidariorum]